MTKLEKKLNSLLTKKDEYYYYLYTDNNNTDYYYITDGKSLSLFNDCGGFVRDVNDFEETVLSLDMRKWKLCKY